MATITANMRTISRQNAGMRKLLELMQGQLAKSSQNDEVIPLGREVNVETAANYEIRRIIQETVIPLEDSRANAPRRQARVFDRLGLTRNRQSRPPIPYLEQATSNQLLFRGKSAWPTSIRNR
ncbi:Hypothetical predicted protein [Olea europaea subsp. europaea]|uniref:Uncharacterized protein n=1 Tax=Olea europaea subsp. europaea TaxID=158383 RepID=A0A8S0PRT9_OLEEU|nr:Hypothetical predicted protein [Olea europaea subsp. europaea]